MTPRKHQARRYRHSGIALGLALAALAAAPARAIENYYPYSIMAPEPRLGEPPPGGGAAQRKPPHDVARA